MKKIGKTIVEEDLQLIAYDLVRRAIGYSELFYGNLREVNDKIVLTKADRLNKILNEIYI